MRKLLIIPFVLFFAVSLATASNADVLIEDMSPSALFNEGGLTSGVLETGGGAGGNFELVACAIDSEAPNPFNLPTPGNWNEIGNASCFLPGCQLGVWWRIADASGPQEITCSWSSDSVPLLVGSIRFSNIDQNDPIIDAACLEVVGTNVVRDAVSSEPGAQLINVFLIQPDGSLPEPGNTFTFSEFDLTEGEFVSAAIVGDGEVLILTGESILDVEGEGSEEIVIPVDGFDQIVQQCVLSIRMQTEVIPTMSEWGLIAAAGLMGIAGALYIRRRKAQTS